MATVKLVGYSALQMRAAVTAKFSRGQLLLFMHQSRAKANSSTCLLTKYQLMLFLFSQQYCWLIGLSQGRLPVKNEGAW